MGSVFSYSDVADPHVDDLPSTTLSEPRLVRAGGGSC